jgi:DNA-binding transcriptional ArsR family regulator
VQAFAALADPTRRRIVELLAERDRDAGELDSAFPVSRPAVSRHLRVLRESGRVFSLDPRPLDELASWLDRYRSFWSQRLDALETELGRSRRHGRTEQLRTDQT